MPIFLVKIYVKFRAILDGICPFNRITLRAGNRVELVATTLELSHPHPGSTHNTNTPPLKALRGRVPSKGLLRPQTSPDTQRPRHGTPPRSETRQRYRPPSRTRSPPRNPQNRELLIRPLDTCAADAAAQMSRGPFKRNNDALDAAKSHDDL